MPSPECFLDQWVTEAPAAEAYPHVRVLTEKEGGRAAALEGLCEAVKDHLVGADVLSRLGYPKAADAVRRSLPTEKKIRSGDLGEIVATEYVIHRTEFTVPVKRLRYKDDRDMPMRGDDIIGLHRSDSRTRILKGEVKSRADLARAVVDDACSALCANDHRPNPDTLSFIARMLRREERDADAEMIEDVQTQHLRYEDIAHLVFTMSGNDPVGALAVHAPARPPIADRRFVGLRVDEHQAFVELVFGTLDGAEH